MVLERDKYRAQFYQVCGLALMSPLGKMIMELESYSLASLNLKMWFIITFYLSLCFCGIIVVSRGLDFLEINKWMILLL